MKIQVISRCRKIENQDNIECSYLDSPKALDDYDINIIDLSTEEIWRYESYQVGRVDALKDLKTIYKMVQSRKTAIVIYVFPKNVTYIYKTGYRNNILNEKFKNIISEITKETLNFTIYPPKALPNIVYGGTSTTILEKQYSADFYFDGAANVRTKSDKSEKTTTVELTNNIFVTTLDITRNIDDLKLYLSYLFEKKRHEAEPKWMEGISFGDDDIQQKRISENMEKIKDAEFEIKKAEEKLEENKKYKSILYTNGDDLVEVVFLILEKLLNCDLSDFIDDKKEDFLIKKPQCTFIGEIKGVTSNVKYEHISQTEVHYRKYLDELEEKNDKENVKQLLIMNPFRNKPLEEREPVCSAQIELANRNNCLIIETKVLLDVFEKFYNSDITSDKCIDVFRKRTGLLNLTDFDETEEDNTPYKI